MQEINKTLDEYAVALNKLATALLPQDPETVVRHMAELAVSSFPYLSREVFAISEDKNECRQAAQMKGQQIFVECTITPPTPTDVEEGGVYVLEELFHTLREGLALPEDRLVLSRLVEAGETIDISEFGDEVVKERMEAFPDHSKLLMDSDCLNALLSTKAEWVRDNYEPARKEFALSYGFVGKLLQKHLVTDSFRYDTLRAINVKEMFLVGPHSATGQLVYNNTPEVTKFRDPKDGKDKLHLRREIWIWDTLQEAGCVRFVMK